MSKFPDCYEQVRSPLPYTLQYYLGFYVFPCLFVFGVGGNLLNLIVFSSRGMRNKANCFLSSMAVADLCFFLAFFLLNTSIYDVCFNSKTFLKLYYHSKSYLTMFSNWFSSASIWFAVMVTMERLIAIRFPLRIRLLWTRRRITFLITFITLFTFVLQMYNLFWYKVTTLPSCSMPNETVYVLKSISSDPNSTAFNYLSVSMYLAPTVTVLVPLVIMTVANALIIYFFRLNSNEIVRLGNYNDKHVAKERKITIMVLVIVTAFLLCNLPSAVTYVVSFFVKIPSITIVTNYLVCLNKALNFFLYCCASKGFRKKCRIIFRHFCHTVWHCGRRGNETERLDEEHGLLMTQTSQALTNHESRRSTRAVSRTMTTDSSVSVRRTNDSKFDYNAT